MTLCIANPTMQDWAFNYRLGEPQSAEFAILRHFFLPRGGRMEMHLTPVQTAQMIRQLEAHGARPASEVRSNLRRITGLLYDDGKTVTIEQVEVAHEAETQTREDRAVSQAVKAGLGFDRAARSSTKERPGARVTEVEVKQETPRGTRKKGGEVDFSLSVAPDGGDDKRVRDVLSG